MKSFSTRCVYKVQNNSNVRPGRANGPWSASLQTIRRSRDIRES